MMRAYLENILSDLSAKPLLKRLLLIALAVKLTILLIIYLSSHLLPFCYPCYQGNFSYLPGKEWGSELNYQTWDAQHYAYLSEHGYSPGLPSNVFFPLFPWLIQLLNTLVQNTIVSGFLVANVCAFVMLIFLYLLIEKLYNDKIAFYTGLFVLAFPTSFYFSLMYSESLFLMLMTGAFYFWYKQETLLASIFAFLLPLTRPVGILLIIPFFLAMFLSKSKFPKTLHVNLPLIVSALLGFGVYLLFMQTFTGSAWSGFEAQNNYVAGNSIQNILHPLLWFKKNFIEITLTLHHYTTSVIDRLFFVGFLVSVFWIYKNMDKAFFYYALVMGMVPALLGSFMAYTRYLVVVFPIFIVLALIFKKKTSYVIIPLFMVQVFLLIVQSLNYWVA